VKTDENGLIKFKKFKKFKITSDSNIPCLGIIPVTIRTIPVTSRGSNPIAGELTAPRRTLEPLTPRGSPSL